MKKCSFRRLLSLLLLTSLWACGSSPKIRATSQKDETGKTSASNLPQLKAEIYELENGLTVILDRDTRLPVVAVEVRYMVGSSHEKPGRSGFAHLFEHLMFQGSANFNDEYFKPYEPIGARVNGTTSTDRTNYYEQVPKEFLEVALWMESDRMANLLPVLTQEKLDNQRDVVKNERRQNYEDRPYGMVWLKIFDEIFPEGHPYDHTPIGSHEDLSAATLDDVKSFFKEYYVPKNAIITLSGDFEVEEAKGLVAKYFAGLESGRRAPTPKVAKPVALTESKHIVEYDQVKLPRIHLVFPTPALYATGDAELDVFSSILTSGKNSRLYRDLVLEKKVAKDVAAFQMSMALGSFYVIQATASPDVSIETLSPLLANSLKEALAHPPTEDEMERALNGWKKAFYGPLESAMARAQLLSGYFHLTGDPNYLSKDLNRYLGLTSESVFESAKTNLTKPNLRIDILPEPAGKAPQEKK